MIFIKLTQLQDLYLDDNNLTILPSSITCCKYLYSLKYENNEIEYITPNIQIFLNRLKHKNHNL
jgi:Leucine-rich repeat (LRR) protein